MRYVNTFMRSYKVIMEEKARQAEYIRKIEIEKILKDHHDRLLKIAKRMRKN
jgi:hypothetical protein